MRALTEHSRSTHGVITEPSHREGKGREGKWKGSRGETPHHGVTLVTREAAPVAPVAPSDDMMTGTSTIEGIDLDAAMPCEHHQHGEIHADEPASYRVRVTHDACAWVRVYYLCASGWSRLLQGNLFCLRCRERGLSAADVHARIVEVLR